jgi:hypothetical protein
MCSVWVLCAICIVRQGADRRVPQEGFAAPRPAAFATMREALRYLPSRRFRPMVKPSMQQLVMQGAGTDHSP